MCNYCFKDDLLVLKYKDEFRIELKRSAIQMVYIAWELGEERLRVCPFTCYTRDLVIENGTVEDYAKIASWLKEGRNGND